MPEKLNDLPKITNQERGISQIQIFWLLATSWAILALSIPDPMLCAVNNHKNAFNPMMVNQEFSGPLSASIDILREITLNYDISIIHRELKSDHQNLQALETASPMDLDGE